MNTDQQKPQRYVEDEEVDFSFIYRKAGAAFQALSAGFSFVASTISRRLLLLTAFVLVGMGLAYGIYATLKPYYTSSMTLFLSEIRNEFVEDQLDKLSEMIQEHNYGAVAERLEITPEAASQIKGMTFSNLDQDRVSADSVLTGSPFRIELRLYDARLFPALEPAITNFLENNPYFSKQKTIKQRQLQSMISKLRGEIASIDSIRTTIVEPRGPVNGFVYGEPIDPTNLYKESMLLYEQQVELEAALDQLDNIQVITSFAPQVRPAGPKLYKYLLLGGSVFFLIGLLLALQLEKKRRR